ncbi:hypothetical protein FB567DRAFT_206896 [Paraphoma chrysanthemicola]|uniref:Uncharacterized protein n=1 Tax=Paraphoma chrysanthemicola TaxID=798071 RepID=A0A8K0QUB0_9PLEO|nr:hypothetical protein FB567DRAFT_206896 [Paraphoma chrysanthemicola]
MNYRWTKETAAGQQSAHPIVVQLRQEATTPKIAAKEDFTLYCRIDIVELVGKGDNLEDDVSEFVDRFGNDLGSNSSLQGEVSQIFRWSSRWSDSTVTLIEVTDDEDYAEVSRSSKSCLSDRYDRTARWVRDHSSSSAIERFMAATERSRQDESLASRFKNLVVEIGVPNQPPDEKLIEAILWGPRWPSSSEALVPISRESVPRVGRGFEKT